MAQNMKLSSNSLRYISLAIATISITAILFQNCSNDGVNFSTVPSLVVVTPGGDCRTGEKLGIWLDPSGSGTIAADQFLGDVVSYSGPITAVANYNYYSASAHIVHGPTPTDNLLNVFFYQELGKEGLYLNIFANKDETGGPGNFELEIITGNNNLSDGIVVVDDPNSTSDINSRELFEGDKYLYKMRFQYSNNTDGLVIGPFLGQQFSIRVKMLKTGNINQGRFFSADGSNFSLKPEIDISSFVFAYRGYETCD